MEQAIKALYVDELENLLDDFMLSLNTEIDDGSIEEDASEKIIEIIKGKPELIIGNYTDGKLVASLMANKLGTTLGTIAHALEKTNYED
ncbi:sucrose synthase 7-like protein [Tanacetum coccineum]